MIIAKFTQFYLKLGKLSACVLPSFMIFLAALINHFFSLSSSYWLLLTTLLIGQTTMAAPLRHALRMVMFLLAILLFVQFLYLIFVLPILVYLVSGFIFIGIAYYLFKKRPQSKKNSLHILLLMSLFLFTVFNPPTLNNLKEVIGDILLGAVYSIIFFALFVPLSPVKKFRLHLSIYLNDLMQLASEIVKYHLLQEEKLSDLSKSISALENTYIEADIYPEWVYEPGFNPGLRSGFRFFLIYLERVADYYLTLNNLLAEKLNKNLLQDLKEPILQVIDKNNELLTILKNYLDQATFPETHSNYTGDIITLEKEAAQFIPSHLELLDISPDYVNLTATIRNLKDTRETLLQLVSALPNHSVS